MQDPNLAYYSNTDANAAAGNNYYNNTNNYDNLGAQRQDSFNFAGGDDNYAASNDNRDYREGGFDKYGRAVALQRTESD